MSQCKHYNKKSLISTIFIIGQWKTIHVDHIESRCAPFQTHVKSMVNLCVILGKWNTPRQKGSIWKFLKKSFKIFNMIPF
jgi:hypothetical protein